MRKIIAVLLTLILVFTNVSNVCYASSESGQFNIVTQEKENGEIVRVYTGRDNSHTYSLRNSAAVNYNEVRELLVQMGRSAETVGLMTEEELTKYVGIPYMYAVTTYYYSDENGNMSIVKERDVEDAISTMSENSYSGMSEDNFMRVTVSAIPLNGGEDYGIDIIAEWLTMPLWRSKDGIAVYGQWCSAYENSGYGWTYYTESQQQGDGSLVVTKTPAQTRTNLSNFQSVSDGNYDGYGTVFNLPNNAETSGAGTGSIYCTGFTAFMYCEVNADQIGWGNMFNVRGTYTHSKVVVVFTPSLSLSGGNLSLSGVLSQESKSALCNCYKSSTVIN